MKARTICGVDPLRFASYRVATVPEPTVGEWDERLRRIAVPIEATTDWGEVAELVTDSYRMTAPKRLDAQLDGPDGRTGNQ